MLVRSALGRENSEEDRSQGNIYLLRSDILSPDVRNALQYAARVVLSSRSGPLSAQVGRVMRRRAIAMVPRHEPRSLPAPQVKSAIADGQLAYFNGLGGFYEAGREYMTILKPGVATPAPWINVIANSEFGFQVSAEGTGFTWAVNSQQNQITAWSNDPVGNGTSEAIYLCDLDTGEVWSPTASPIRDNEGTYVARHGQGYSKFNTNPAVSPSSWYNSLP